MLDARDSRTIMWRSVEKKKKGKESVPRNIGQLFSFSARRIKQVFNECKGYEPPVKEYKPGTGSGKAVYL